MNAVTRSVIALFAFAGLVACGAPPETTSSTSGELTSIGTPPPVSPPPVNKPPPVDPPPPHAPTPPVWPPPNATYCPANYGDGTCSVWPVTRWNVLGDAALAALGCTPAQELDGTSAYPDGAGFSVCFSSPAVSTLSPLAITCDACLPELPAGEVYILTGAPERKPTCPSGCPSGGSPIGHVGGGTGTVSSSK